MGLPFRRRVRIRFETKRNGKNSTEPSIRVLSACLVNDGGLYVPTPWVGEQAVGHSGSGGRAAELDCVHVCSSV